MDEDELHYVKCTVVLAAAGFAFGLVYLAIIALWGDLLNVMAGTFGRGPAIMMVFAGAACGYLLRVLAERLFGYSGKQLFLPLVLATLTCFWSTYLLSWWLVGVSGDGLKFLIGAALFMMLLVAAFEVCTEGT